MVMTTPAVVGHRGWPTRYPDNTLSGIYAAAGMADAVEVDVRRSGDGKLILSHDPVLEGLIVSDHPWTVLGEADLGDGHRPALLDEAIASVPGLSFQFEIKNMPYEPGFEPDHRLALEAAERARPGDIVTSFNWETLNAVRRVFPDVGTGVLVESGGDIDLAIAICHDFGHRTLLPSVFLPFLGMVQAIESGLEVCPWVVNDPDLVMELAGISVSGIITDDPALVRTALYTRT
jgi:glycerophosphoryl diester phosphodiesterase